jgi:ABC-type phosphate/phosphonate transport system substrate-binding protein
VIAALPMYDRPENAGAHDALWAGVREGLRRRGLAAPDALDRAVNHVEGWGRPDLLLGQICNLPWRARFRDRVAILGAATYDAGEGPGLYHSVIVARADDPAPGPRFALNDPLSNSGWDMPQEWARAAGVTLRPVLVTGSHAESLRAVVDGRADLAGIDAVTFRNMLRWDEAAALVRVLARTGSTPGMSFVTARGNDPAPIRAALAEALAELKPEAAEVLGLRGLAVLPPSAYERPLPPAPLLAPA